MAYLDGELKPGRANATAAHLGECAECQELVAELRGVSQNLKSWGVDAAELAMPQAIATALAESTAVSGNVFPARRWDWRGSLGRRWATVAWVGAVAVVLVLTLNRPLLRSRMAHERAAKGDGLAVTTNAQVSAENGRVVMEQNNMQAQAAMLLQGRNFSQLAQLQPGESSVLQADPSVNGPMIIRSAQVSLVTKDFDKARVNIEAILTRHRGYVGELNVGGSTGSGRTLTATLRVPADQLDATVAEVKTLGRVESESQSGQDVTAQYVDLQARLGNARNTESRLTDLLRNRTGKLSDVLAVEQELGRVRGEIEQMEAERKTMANQVNYATLGATITEDYKAELQVVPPSTFTRLGNAAVEGYRGMVDGVVGVAMFLLSIGPSLLLWGAVLFFPARLLWRKLRGSFVS